jgi:hypothetical protein
MMFSWLKRKWGGSAAVERSKSPARNATPASPPERTEADALADLEQFIATLVAAGFDTPEEILQAASDYLAGDLDQRRIDLESGPMLERALAAHAAAEAGWPALTDCDRLDAAFAALEQQGVIARQNFSCCGNCGSSEIWGEIDAARDAGDPAYGYAFYHIQDTENAADGGALFLNYGAVDEGEAAALSVAHEIVDALKAKGLETDWDGSWDRRIGVSLDWKRRRNRAAAAASTTLH